MVLRLSKGCRMRHNQFVSWRPNGPSLETSTASKDNYSVDELMTDLRKGIFLSSGNKPDRYVPKKCTRSYMLSWLNYLNRGRLQVPDLPTTRSLAQTDLPSIRGQLLSLKSDLKISTSKIQDKMSKYHLLDLINRISEGLDPK
jgi:hypothetical protein